MQFKYLSVVLLFIWNQEDSVDSFIIIKSKIVAHLVSSLEREIFAHALWDFANIILASSHRAHYKPIFCEHDQTELSSGLVTL
jgi:hypothetical protein